MGQEPMLSGWVAAPLTALVLLFLASHVLGMQRTHRPSLRRRIRTANGFLMMLCAGVFGFALSGVSPAQPKAFVLVWSGLFGLLGMVVILAVADALNTLRLHHSVSARTRRAVRAALEAYWGERSRSEGRVEGEPAGDRG